MKTEADAKSGSLPATAAPSIASRLTLGYTLWALIILVASTTGLYALLAHALDRENRDLVMTLLSVLTEDAEEDDSHFLLPGMLSAKQPYQLRVFDENMRPLASSTAMEFIPVPELTAHAERILEWDLPAGHFMSAANWTRDAPGVPRRMVQVAVDVSDDQELLALYRMGTVLVLVAGLGACALTSFVIVRRGLRPLQEVMETTERITVNQLHERLVATQWPKELVELATSFNFMLARLDRAFQRVSRASSTLAHQLRTPVNNLIGEADVALSRGRSTDEYRAVLESAMEEYQRLAKIIDTLLFFTRIDNPHHKLKLERFDAGTEVQKIIDFFEPLALEAEVDLSHTGTALVTANQTLFGQALGNLLSNALQHTVPGGRVTVTIENTDHAAVISVSDSGHGIIADDLPHVMEPFYRSEGSRSNRKSGMGLGLSIVRSIVEWHDGQVKIASTLGVGTTVTLWLPHSAQKPSSAQARR